MKPDWKELGLREVISMPDAIWISLGIDPVYAERYRLSSPDFGKRMDTLRFKKFSATGHWDGSGWPMIPLYEFARWAQETHWQIPDELRNLAKDQRKLNDGTTKRLRRIYQEFLNEHGKPPSQRKLAELADVGRGTVSKRWGSIEGPN